MIAHEAGLVIEGVQMRRAALHEEEDDALGASGEMRGLGNQRTGVAQTRAGCSGSSAGLLSCGIGDTACKREVAKTARGGLEHGAAGKTGSKGVDHDAVS